MNKRIKSILKKIISRIPINNGKEIFSIWLANISSQEPKTSMRTLLEIDELLKREIDKVAIRYDNGVHVKHRLTNYHQFFVDRINDGEQILDIGCGNGALAHDIVIKSGASVTGIDINPISLAFAKSRFENPKLRFIEADALSYSPTTQYDTIVLSNVLEHIEERVQFLKRIQEGIGAKKFLIRVPMINRHWQVKMRQELGMNYFSDPSHFVEYTQQNFIEELNTAGLSITFLQVNWGEIWAEAHPTNVNLTKS